MNCIILLLTLLIIVCVVIIFVLLIKRRQMCYYETYIPSNETKFDYRKDVQIPKIQMSNNQFDITKLYYNGKPLLDYMYPIGCVMIFDEGINPNTFIPNTTWEELPKDNFIYCGDKYEELNITNNSSISLSDIFKQLILWYCIISGSDGTSRYIRSNESENHYFDNIPSIIYNPINKVSSNQWVKPATPYVVFSFWKRVKNKTDEKFTSENINNINANIVNIGKYSDFMTNNFNKVYILSTDILNDSNLYKYNKSGLLSNKDDYYSYCMSSCNYRTTFKLSEISDKIFENLPELKYYSVIYSNKYELLTNKDKSTNIDIVNINEQKVKDKEYNSLPPYTRMYLYSIGGTITNVKKLINNINSLHNTFTGVLSYSDKIIPPINKLLTYINEKPYTQIPKNIINELNSIYNRFFSYNNKYIELEKIRKTYGYNEYQKHYMELYNIINGGGLTNYLYFADTITNFINDTSTETQNIFTPIDNSYNNGINVSQNIDIINTTNIVFDDDYKLEDIFPKNTCLMFTENIDPNNLFPNTKWIQIKDKFIYINASDNEGGIKENTINLHDLKYYTEKINTTVFTQHQILEYTYTTNNHSTCNNSNTHIFEGKQTTSKGTQIKIKTDDCGMAVNKTYYLDTTVVKSNIPGDIIDDNIIINNYPSKYVSLFVWKRTE